MYKSNDLAILNNIQNDKQFPLKVKGTFYATVMRARMMYGSENWALNKRD